MYARGLSFVVETLFVGQANTDHSVLVPMAISEIRWMKKLDALRKSVPIIKIVQEIAFVKNIDALLH